MEEILQFAWQHRLWGDAPQAEESPLGTPHFVGVGEGLLVDGRKLTVLDPGRLNRDAGPDFFNGKVLIDGTEWVGNIEIHVRASDWRRHGHSSDPAYDNVVLHVVGVDDDRVPDPSGRGEVPQLAIGLHPQMVERYAQLAEGSAGIRCAPWIGSALSPLALTDCLETLAVERLQRKAERICELVDSCGGSWQQACFATLARAFGFGLNADALEQLGRITPLSVLGRHSDDLMQLEALLFGQAGMLEPAAYMFDAYFQRLCREYYFLRKKYELRPMARVAWRFARTRPQNFPHRRIAMLACACLGQFRLLGHLLEARTDADDVRLLFDWQLMGYWAEHYSFGAEPHPAPALLSQASRDSLIINCVAPLLYAYGARHGDSERAERALDLLCQLPPERNVIVRNWMSLGIKPDNAMRSQALIELKNEYCDARKCMYCRVGHRTLRYALAPQPFKND